jgi:hypothetical protein
MRWLRKRRRGFSRRRQRHPPSRFAGSSPAMVTKRKRHLPAPYAKRHRTCGRSAQLVACGLCCHITGEAPRDPCGCCAGPPRRIIDKARDCSPTAAGQARRRVVPILWCRAATQEHAWLIEHAAPSTTDPPRKQPFGPPPRSRRRSLPSHRQHRAVRRQFLFGSIATCSSTFRRTGQAGRTGSTPRFEGLRAFDYRASTRRLCRVWVASPGRRSGGLHPEPSTASSCLGAHER